MDEISSKQVKRKGSDKGLDRSAKVPRNAPEPIRVSSSEDRSSVKASKTDSPRPSEDKKGYEDRTNEESVLRDKVCSTLPYPFG
jgi:hypothetical protein